MSQEKTNADVIKEMIEIEMKKSNESNGMKKLDTPNGVLTRKYSPDMDYDCDCGGEFFSDGTGSHTVPVGIGTVNGVFGVTKIKYTGWILTCYKCGRVLMSYEKKEVIHIPI